MCFLFYNTVKERHHAVSSTLATSNHFRFRRTEIFRSVISNIGKCVDLLSFIAQIVDAIQKCVAQTDPHIQVFHPTKNNSGPNLDECLDNGRHEFVYNNYIIIEMNVVDTYITDVNFLENFLV